MKQMVIFIVLAAISIGVSPCFAEGFYVGGSHGKSGVRDTDSPGIGGQTISSDVEGRSYSGFAGYNFRKSRARLGWGYLGLEAGLVDFGRSTDATGYIEGRSANITGTLNWGIGPLMVFGAVGYSRWETKSNYLTGNATRYSGDGRSQGVGFKVETRKFSLVYAYMVYPVEQVDSVAVMSLGFSWNLGR